MAGNINDLMNLYQRLRQNPTQILRSRFNIPESVDVNNPNSIIQHLLNTGQVTQGQVNQVMGMKNNPVLRQIMGEKQ